MSIPLFIITFLITMPALWSLIIIINQNGYKESIFTVTGAVYDTASKGRSIYLVGIIDNKREIFTPSEIKLCHNKDGILSIYPVGSKTNTIYNANVTETLFNRSAIRVLKAETKISNHLQTVLVYLFVFFLPSLFLIIYGYRNSGTLFKKQGLLRSWRSNQSLHGSGPQ